MLAHPAARERYDRRSGRALRSGATTLRIVGRRVRPLPDDRTDVIEVQVEPPTHAVVSVAADQPWIRPTTHQLHLGAAAPRVVISFDDRQLPWRSGRGTVVFRLGDQEERVEYRSPHLLHRIGRTLNLTR